VPWKVALSVSNLVANSPDLPRQSNSVEKTLPLASVDIRDRHWGHDILDLGGDLEALSLVAVSAGALRCVGV